MSIDYLKMFLYVIEKGSISKAAEDMHISQSALSQQIKNMEQTLGVTLLKRSPKGIFPTKTGEIVYEYAQSITQTYNQMLQDITQRQTENRKLHILSTPMVYSYALPCTLYHIKKNFPTYVLEMEAMASDEQEEKIKRGFGHVGFIVGKPKDKSLISKKVFSDTVYLVAGTDINIPSTITCEDIYHYPMLMLSKSQKSRRILNAYLDQAGMDTGRMQILYDLDSTESIKVSAVKSFGLAFLPYMAIKKELYNKQLRIIKIQDLDFEYHYYLIKKPHSEFDHPELVKPVAYIEKILKDTIC